MESNRGFESTRIALDTLGCKLNQAETEILAKQLAEAGCSLVSPAGEADVYILNTCTVTHVADRKSRCWLRAAHRRNPNALVVATGCYAQRAPQELARIEGVSLVVGNEEKSRLLRRLELCSRLSCPGSIPGDPTTNNHGGFRTRAFIKIQDGCSNFCAYCIVPLVRGKEKSLPTESVVAEVKARTASGYKEVVLTGTEIGSYSYDGANLKRLLERILAEADVARLRLSSLQPQEISPDFIQLWRDRRLCRHLHLSLQSGSDAVLERMKRCYPTNDYQRAVSLIRSVVPEAAITTDVIVGFPGETSAEFEESYEFCRKLEFARIHVFSYSPRPGTQATKMRGQINARVKKQRSQKMLALAEESAQNFRQKFLDRMMTVLWEQQSGGVWFGLTDNYIKVYTRSSEDLTSKLLPVKLLSIWKDGVWGEVKDS